MVLTSFIKKCILTVCPEIRFNDLRRHSNDENGGGV